MFDPIYEILFSFITLRTYLFCSYFWEFVEELNPMENE